jgi:hypothetical protein
MSKCECFMGGLLMVNVWVNCNYLLVVFLVVCLVV